MDWLALQYIVLFCVQWINFRSVLGIDIHVYYDRNGTSAADTSLIFESGNFGDGWSYHIDRNSRSTEINKFILLDASSGNVYLRWQDICRSIKHLPLDFRIVARTNIHSQDSNLIANYTITPLSVYIDDLPCHTLIQQTETDNAVEKYSQIVLFSNYFSTLYGVECFWKDTSLLSLYHYIPYSLRKSSFCDVKIEIPGFSYDKETSLISTRSVQCLQSTELLILLNLKPCRYESVRDPVLVKISIHDSRSLDTGFHVVKVKKEPHRLKRTATAPQFSKSEFTVTVPENEAIGYTVIHITATDPDDGEAGEITYRLDPLQNALSGNMFAIDPISGIVKTTEVLDREDIPRHLFTVRATDSSMLMKSTIARLTIIVEDDNDNAPTFDENVYTVETHENIPVTSTITTLRAQDYDKDENSEITYRIIEPLSQTTFRIDPSSGSISTLKVLDRETVASYQLIVQATDHAPLGKQKSSTATVSITVLDENDNFPQFDKTSYTVNISENLDITNKPVIGRVSATDDDEGRNQQITYSITGGNTGNTFYIDQTTGEVSVQKAVDYEVQHDFKLSIKAADNGIPAKTNSVIMWVRIKDLNDNAPYFQNSIYRGTVLENEGSSTSVLTIRALDDDSGINKMLKYSIINAPQNLPFVIDPDSGLITVRATLDREIQQAYSFTVQVKDQGQPTLSATAAVEITVRDINDNSPIFSQKTFSVSVSEDTQLYKQIIKVTASDADADENAVLTYSIESGNNDQMFAIGRETGTITLIKYLDYKIQSRYILNVRATDSGERYDTAEVHINVTDINKHDPSFENAPYQLNIDEGEDVGKSVGKVYAVDKDVGENGRITYELLNNDQEFRIDHNTGVIFAREVLDRELKAAYAFDVKASDHGDPVKSDTAGVIVVVNDKNDNAPAFDKPVYEASVGEDVFDGDLVTKVHAVDLDDGINSQVQYRFADDSDGKSDFEIDDASGQIRVAKNSKIDRERRSNYTLSVLAVDGGVIPQTGSVKVKIKIEDINDNEPKFPQDEIIAMVSENKKIGSTVAVIEAVDPDEGVNAVVEYLIVGGLDADKFVLDTRPGDPAIIINRIPLDYESDKKEYQVLLEASSGVFFSRALIRIQVQDVNDNSPVLKDFVIIFNNFVDTFSSEPIGRIPAFDPDVSDRDRLKYQFLSGNDAGFLELNASTGEITLDSRLNSDVSRNGTLQVQVSDGLNVVKAKCLLYVRLVTTEMLGSSVTIRINNMTSSAFLSPLFSFFVDALAIIINTDKNNIFVINIRNDTEVSGQILNVTVAVRQKIERRDRQKVDVFYSAEFLKEQIYLQRTLLANLSTLQVLPFDDNLCLQEMCPSFHICQSWLKFGRAAPFITSDTMLFRPIYPDSSFGCVCPEGFTGHSKEVFYFCDTEVDLCYSNPCNNSGTCIRKEGGYTCQCYEGYAGENCEITQSEKYTESTCPDAACRPPSTCVPLIQGGFRCEGCPNSVDYNEFCQLTTRSFPKGSFLMFQTLKSRYRFKIQLEFATHEKNGLLFYNGRFNELHDFIALEIVDRQIQFSFSVGDSIEKVSPYVEDGVSNGHWQQVTVDYLNMTATVTVGADCDTEISVQYGKSINYTCAARVTHELAPECSLPSKNCQRLLDLTGPMQVGGLPTLPSSFQVQNKDYVGCMRNILIDGQLLDLNTSIANNGTEVGCESKKQFCKGAPCAHGGSCTDGWRTYRCLCPDGWGGKDCTTVTESQRQLSGDGYMHYSNGNRLIPAVNTKWFNGLSFRTRSQTGTLMFILEQNAENIFIQLKDGYIVYTYNSRAGDQEFKFDTALVNDGQWHDFEARWQENQLILILDYGQIERVYPIQNTLVQKIISDVYVGALKMPDVPADNFFTGCIKNPRVGNTQNSVLQKPEIVNAPKGCNSPDLCDTSPCVTRAECVSEWEGYTCKCPPGTLGPNCDNICTQYNPCQNMANCRHQPGSSYTCECGKLQSGQYCEVVTTQPCPAKWWGYPVCGPCPAECSTENGFDPNCDSITGKCSCLASHYRPAGSDVCLPCQCYGHGSTDFQCHPVTGQCPCIEGVAGRRCNQCPSKYAEIRMDEETAEYGCQVDYEACPRIFSHEMWWETKMVNVMVWQECPNRAVGKVTRNCSGDATWQEPDFFNCTNAVFLKHLEQVERIESGALKINTFVAKTTLGSLANSTSETDTMYGNDLNVTLRIMRLILDYENSLLNLSEPQSVLDLTSERDSQYLSNMMTVLSDVFQPKYKSEWTRLNREGDGAQGLAVRLEHYLSTLVSALELTAAETPAPYNIVTDNIVLAVDTIKKQNFSGKTIPKYDNIVKTSTFDDYTNIKLPKAAINPYRDFITSGIEPPHKAYVGYVLYRYLGELLQVNPGPGVRVIEDRPMAINSPLFSIVLRDDGKEVNTTLPEPVMITFKQMHTENRASPQCVFLQNSGRWSTRGCTEAGRYTVGEDMFVKCSCNHMTSFAVLMDISDREYVQPEPVPLEVITFVGLIVCMGCLALSFIIFFCFKRLQSNTTSIHTNLVFAIFICKLAFLVGINKVEKENELFCRLVAIILHYFYMTGFAWLFVDILHIYRMLTEVRNIDQGSMKFYYLLGYVIPGIIVSLAVGLNTEGYGTKDFCWLSMSDKFIWSFAGPITVVVIVNVFMFVMAVKASCREKISVTDLTPLRFGLFANIIILMLCGIVWVVSLLAVNFNIMALHYLYAILSPALGVFIFIIYILANSKVRLELKKMWYGVRGKKLDLDDNIGGTRSSVYSRSALAYRNDSCDNGLARINVGISTTSTTSRSTSKSSGGMYKGEDYLRSTSTSTSGNIPPVKYPKNGLPPPYGYDPEKTDDLDPDSIQIRPKHDANDSDSDSEMSERVSLDLASSHSSDDEDDIDVNMDWEKQMPKNKKVEEAKEQARLKHKDEQSPQFSQRPSLPTPPPQVPVSQHQYQNPFEQIYSGPQSTYSPKLNHNPGQWPGDPQLSGYTGSESEYMSVDRPTLSSVQPDVTLQTPEYKGREFMITPPRRQDSLLNESNSSANKESYPSPFGSPQLKHSPRGAPGSPIQILSSPLGSPRDRMTVKVLTHRGSVSTDSECSHETCV